MKRDGYINTYAIQQFSHEVTFNDINRVLVFQKVRFILNDNILFPGDYKKSSF